MNAKTLIAPIACALGIALMATSCTTTYDAQGRPVQSVTPEGAALTAAAAGLVGYALAKDNNDRHRYHRGGYGRYNYGHRRGNYHHCGRYYH